MGEFIKFVIGLVTLGYVFCHGLILLISPRRWFHSRWTITGAAPEAGLELRDGRLSVRVFGLLLSLFGSYGLVVVIRSASGS